MLTKKEKELANFCARIYNNEDRETLIQQMIIFCRESKPKFDAYRFREWVIRVHAGKSTVGLKWVIGNTSKVMSF